MSIFDVRCNGSSEITEIRFAESENCGSDQASTISESRNSGNQVFIYEGGQGDSIRVNGKVHALDLIAALQKAIELDWLN